MEVTKVNSSMYKEQHSEVEDEEVEEDDNNEEISTTINQGVTMSELDLNHCSDTHIGSKRVFHGPVEVNHVVEIPANQQMGPTLPFTFPKRLDIPAKQDVNGASSPPPSLGYYGLPIPGVSWAGTTAAATTTVPSTGASSRNLSADQVPLLEDSKEGNVTIGRKYCLLLVIVICSLLTAVVLTVIYGHIKKQSGDNLPVNFTHFYRDRSKWHALAPKTSIPFFDYSPPKFVIISHTASHPCSTPLNCSVAIRNIQAGQMASTFDDIAYNFLVAGDGLIYEGRGWKERSAVIHGMGCSSLAVAFVGNFLNVTPPKQQFDALELLLDTSENIGKLGKNYVMFMYNDIKEKSESPGEPVSKILRKWPHWQPFDSSDYLCNKTLKMGG